MKPERDPDLAARVAQATELLETLHADRGLLAGVDRAERERFLVAAGRVARPGPREKRALTRAFRRQRREAVKAADAQVLDQTGIRALRRAPVFATPQLEAPVAGGAELPDEPEQVPEQVIAPRVCYVCKARFHELHHFYDQMCPACAALNWDKRQQRADLSGRVALITGARVKIGYQAAIKLLRAGAHVVVTTRFPRDAAGRYAREPDAAAWSGRLEIHGLDLRHTPSVEAFARHLLETLPRLDFILNNACQTVRRPPGFYAHLMDGERRPLLSMAEPERALLAGFDALAASHDAASLSQVALLPDDLQRSARIFPTGRLDADLQQVDLRARNSWRLAMDEVSAVELLEVQLVNAVAPFILNARLKPLMLRYPSPDKHIVNVSAMEGQFYRKWKTDKHPHTNMAKAALNMMTRTSAADYARDGIHMNSVDTGWVTDEDPAQIAARKTEIHGFHPPLDVVDGAARICDPIFSGFLTGEHRWGLFFKDYAPTDW